MSFHIQTKEELEKFITHNWNKVNEFIDTFSKDLPVPLYTSVDIRESKTKFAPVDNNLYPAGFNNVCIFDLTMAAERFKNTILDQVPKAKRLGLIPESHTKNLFYLDHLYTLQNTLIQAGFEVDIVTCDESLFIQEKVLNLESKSGHPVKIQYCDFKTCTYDAWILNNDQSNPLEIDWHHVQTPVLPSPFLGWTKRQKNQHFEFYSEVLKTFCDKFSIDMNLLQAQFRKVEEVDFSSKDGLEVLAKEVDKLKSQLPEDNPIFVKASQGTYGMGISVVNSGQDILEMNRKTRNKMDIGKNKIKFTSLILQEGVETVLKYDGTPAEVTIYLVGGKSTGGFMRVNPLKGTNANLNAKGMVYQKFCISEIQENSEHKAKESVYSIIARLSTLATAMELQQIEKEMR